MNLPVGDELTALVFIVIFLSFIIVFTIYERVRSGGRNLRDIPAFNALIRAIGLSVEDGTRLHVSLGSSDMAGEGSGAGLAALTILERVARTASVSDNPPVVTSGEGVLAVLSRQALSGAFRAVEASEQFDPNQGRMTGATPFSYAAGAMPVIFDEQVSTNILVGNFGPEIALITEAADRSGGFTLAGTDNTPAQAVLYAAAQEPLIGEELYAGGAYLRAGNAHTASLRVQDIFRWLIIAFIIGGGVLRFIQGVAP